MVILLVLAASCDFMNMLPIHMANYLGSAMLWSHPPVTGLDLMG